MSNSFAIHIGVATPLIATSGGQYLASSDVEWARLTERMEEYTVRSVNAAARICDHFNIQSRRRLVAEGATRQALMDAFEDALRSIGENGLLVLSFAGHGQLSKDQEGDEADGCDTGWLLADVAFNDDELRAQLRRVPERCTVIVLGDCCRAAGMDLQRLCEPNPSSTRPAPPSAARVYINAADKADYWIPGNGDRSFTEEVRDFVIDPACATYTLLQQRFDPMNTSNRHRSVVCAPNETWLWNAHPFVKAR